MVLDNINCVMLCMWFALNFFFIKVVVVCTALFSKTVNQNLLTSAVSVCRKVPQLGFETANVPS